MKKKFLLTTLMMILLIATQASARSFSNGKKGSGNMETRELSLKKFNAIEVGGIFDIDVSFGSRQKVEVTIDDNLWEEFEARVKGNWLDLDWGRNCHPSNDCKIRIVLKSLEEVNIHGACNLDVSDFEGYDFTYRLSGAGKLKMDGEVDKLKIKISGAGEADTTDLIAKHVDVHISGAGDASVYAGESIRGRVSGIGNLYYYGNPDETENRVSGLGSITKK